MPKKEEKVEIVDPKLEIVDPKVEEPKEEVQVVDAEKDPAPNAEKDSVVAIENDPAVEVKEPEAPVEPDLNLTLGDFQEELKEVLPGVEVKLESLTLLDDLEQDELMKRIEVLYSGDFKGDFVNEYETLRYNCIRFALPLRDKSEIFPMYR